MSQYIPTEISKVFWASNEGFKTGRDPLGIQNSSIATYNVLLPGITNLTGHIRYYSLYCWLLNEYDNLSHAAIHQYNFIRRAELAIALIMKGQNVRSVVGSNFISQGRIKFRKGIYNLADGGDYESKDKYWAFNSGAFGQYYYGSLNYFELVTIDNFRFNIQEKGKELACAVCNSVDEEARKLFIDSVLDGRLSEESINKLQSLSLTRIDRKSDEWEKLNHLLFMAENDSSLRQESILLMLEDIKNQIPINEFVKRRYLSTLSQQGNGATFGWYFYFLCESLHYCIETVFCLILNEISNLNNPPTKQLINHLIGIVTSKLEGTTDFNRIDEWRKNIIDNIDILFYDIKETVNMKNYCLATTKALTLLLRLYNEYERNSRIIDKFERKHDLSNQRGVISNGLKSYVGNHLNKDIPQYIEALVLQIMQEHTIIALKKMGNSNVDLRKFLLENGHVVLVERRYPNETSPRLNSLYNFLQDLHYIDSNNQLTDIAKKYLSHHGEK